MNPAPAKKKKILVFYASAGHGHEKAARSVSEALSGMAPEVAVKCLDTVDLMPGILGEGYRQTYLWQIRHAPWLWGFFYNSLDLPFVYFFIRPLRRLFNRLAARPLERMLVEEDPDVVLATHFLAIEVASHLKIERKIHSKILAIVTDYLPHAVWMADGVDGYAVACAETQKDLERRGVSADRIHVTGIPIESKFSQAQSRAALDAKFMIQRSGPVVLVTSGGAGIGSLSEIVEKLLAASFKPTVLAVCGTNRALETRLLRTASAEPRLKVFGFVNNMEELMEAADLVIGKAGGLTITESFAKAKPVLLYRSIPGQESRNAAIVERAGAGFRVQTASEVVRRSEEILRDAAKLKAFSLAAARLSHPLAANRIAEWATGKV